VARQLRLWKTESPKLPLEIKEWSDKIYAVDNQKYRYLIKWINAAQRTYPIEVISESLRQFYERAVYTVGPNWWAYLDRILDRAEGRRNGRESQAEAEDIKQAERDYLRTIKR